VGDWQLTLRASPPRLHVESLGTREGARWKSQREGDKEELVELSGRGSAGDDRLQIKR